MATVGDFIGSAAPGVLSAEFGRGIMFDASLSAAATGLTYDPTGEFEQTGFSASNTLSAESLLASVLFDADIVAKSATLDAVNLGGSSFGTTLVGCGSLTADLLIGEAFSAVLTGASTLSGSTQRGLIFEAALTGAGSLSADTTTPVSTDVTTAWVVNLTTGGHARYVGALDGSEQVDAYALTGVTDFETTQKKITPDLYLYARLSGEVKITRFADEQTEHVGAELTDDGRTGIHRHRDKGPRGLSATAWQYKIENVNGSDFDIKQLEVVPTASLKRVR
jgi:hypothetical protein